MSEYDLKKLVKRCQEKEKVGFDYVTKIKKVFKSGGRFRKSYDGKKRLNNEGFTEAMYQVVMKKG